jgi:transcriptional regulator with XRE-family HTH domain
MDYAVSCTVMQRGSTQKLADLRDSRRAKGLSQTAVAEGIGISQSTVSRRERKPPQRHSDATYKLCKYAEQTVGKSKAADQRATKKSFDEVWNKSDAHAAALSKIIEAFVEFCRAEREDEEGPG